MSSQTSRALDERLLDTPEAARQLGVTPGHLQKLRVFGGGPEFIKLSRTVRYQPSALAAWVDTARRRSTSDRGNAA